MPQAPERLNFLFFLAIVTGTIPILIAPFLIPVGEETEASRKQVITLSLTFWHCACCQPHFLALCMLSASLSGCFQENFWMPSCWRLPFGYSISVLLITVTLASTFHRTIAFVIVLLIILTTPFAMIIPTNAHVGPMHEPPAAIDEVLIPPEECAHHPEEPERDSDFEMELRCVCLCVWKSSKHI